ITTATLCRIGTATRYRATDLRSTAGTRLSRYLHSPPIVDAIRRRLRWQSGLPFADVEGGGGQNSRPPASRIPLPAFCEKSKVWAYPFFVTANYYIQL